MNSFTMQPTFTEDVPLHANEVVARIRKVIRTDEIGKHVDSAGYGACAQSLLHRQPNIFKDGSSAMVPGNIAIPSASVSVRVASGGGVDTLE